MSEIILGNLMLAILLIVNNLWGRKPVRNTVRLVNVRYLTGFSSK